MKKALTSLLLSAAISFAIFGQADHFTTKQQIDSLLNLSNTLAGQRDFEKALSMLKNAEEAVLRNNGPESDEYGDVCFRYGTVLKEKGSYREAEQWLLKCKNIREATKGRENPAYATCLHMLGLVYYHTGNNYEKAEKCYLEARAIQEINPGRESMDYVRTTHELGHLFLYTGNYVFAEKHYLEAAELHKKLTGKEDVFYGSIQRTLGMLYCKQQRYETGIDYFESNISIVEKEIGKNSIPYAAGIMSLAWPLIETGKLAKAETLLLESKGIFENLPNYPEIPSYMSLMEFIGDLYYRTGRYDESEFYHLRSKSLRESNLGKEHLSVEMSLGCLSDLYWKTGNAKQAAHCFTEGSSMRRRHLSNAARHFSEKEVHAFTTLFEEALGKHFSFASEFHATAPEFTGACFDNVLFYKGFLLNTACKFRNADLADPGFAEKLGLWKNCQTQLSTELARPAGEKKMLLIDSLETQANALEKDLARTVAGFGEAVRQVNWQEVQAALKPGEAALEFVHFNYFKPEPTDSVLYAALLLSPGMQQPLFIPLFEEKTLEALLPPPGKNRSEYVSDLYHNEALTTFIWSPIEPHLQGVKTVYYSPSGLLHRLNLEALQVTGGSPLFSRFEIVQLGSSRQLVTSTSTTPATATATLFGGIQYDMDSTAITAVATDALATSTRGLAFSETDSTLRGSSWKYLKNSEKETANVAAILEQAGIPATAFRGYAATEEAFKRMGKRGTSPRILHLSTHGYFFPDAGNRSEGRGVRDEGPAFKGSAHPMIRSGLILAGANHAWQTGRPLGSGRLESISTATAPWAMACPMCCVPAATIAACCPRRSARSTPERHAIVTPDPASS